MLFNSDRSAEGGTANFRNIYKLCAFENYKKAPAKRNQIYRDKISGRYKAIVCKYMWKGTMGEFMVSWGRKVRQAEKYFFNFAFNQNQTSQHFNWKREFNILSRIKK